MSLLSIRDLKVEFSTYGGTVQAVRGVNLDVHKGKTLAIVGESGCGKSVTVQSILGLIPSPPGRIVSGSANFKGIEMIGLRVNELNKIRGKQIGMIFQDPMTSLNPTMTVGNQIMETLLIHNKLSNDKARTRAIQLLEDVHIPEAATRVDHYPFQFSGGMRQRVMIAMAIACEPELLIADEPTTALDVTIQAQILNLLQELQIKNKMGLIIITHDLGVVARMADEVAVMYAGQVVERGTASEVFYKSRHPYTMGLKQALPSPTPARTKLIPIEGAPPDLFAPPLGCGFYARCQSAMKICKDHSPQEFSVGNHMGRCWLHHPQAKGVEL
jgi:oligopeptide/dipeptide ABC transporter ATP-binding protein